MALAAATPTRVTNNFNIFEAFGSITVSGSYVVGGDTLDLSQLGIPSNSVPDEVDIIEQPPSGTTASGCDYRFALGTTQANGKVQVFKGGTQETAVTYASLNVANLYYRARFLKFQ